MGTYVLAADAALSLLSERGSLPAKHQVMAPAVLRSDVLAGLYDAVRRGEITPEEARARQNHLPTLKLRLLGDRVLQREALGVAIRLELPDTGDAEYIALTTLHADALVTDVADLPVAGLIETIPLAQLR